MTKRNTYIIDIHKNGFTIGGSCKAGQWNEHIKALKEMLEKTQK
jgi:hypothetical protein